MDELHRVLEGDHVLLAAAVDEIDHGGQSRGLAAPGGTGDQDEALRQFAEIGHHLRHPELLETQDGGRDQTKNRADPAEISKEIDPESGDARQRESEIGVVRLLELGSIAILELVTEQLENGFLSEGRDIGDGRASPRRSAIAGADHR